MLMMAKIQMFLPVLARTGIIKRPMQRKKKNHLLCIKNEQTNYTGCTCVLNNQTNKFKHNKSSKLIWLRFSKMFHTTREVTMGVECLPFAL